jgi:hypothetical protein
MPTDWPLHTFREDHGLVVGTWPWQQCCPKDCEVGCVSEWETITVDIHNMNEVVERSFAAKFRPLNLGTEVTLDEVGVKLATKAAAYRNHNAARYGRQLKYGFKQDGHAVGAFSELAVIALTGIPKWIVVPPDLGKGKCKSADVGNSLQVRGTPHEHGHLLVHPDDEDSPFVLATANPPSPRVLVYGWLMGSEAKAVGKWTNFGTQHDQCYAAHQSQLHDLCELPEDNMAWLRSLPRGYADAIKDREKQLQDGRLRF